MYIVTLTLLALVVLFSFQMAKSKFEYVRKFELDDRSGFESDSLKVIAFTLGLCGLGLFPNSILGIRLLKYMKLSKIIMYSPTSFTTRVSNPFGNNFKFVQIKCDEMRMGMSIRGRQGYTE